MHFDDLSFAKRQAAIRLLEGDDDDDITIGGDAAQTVQATTLVSQLLQAAGGIAGATINNKAAAAKAAGKPAPAALAQPAAPGLPTRVPKSTATNWWLVGGGIAAVGLLGIIGYKLASRSGGRDHRGRAR